jgi:predicted ester cyclase
MPNFTIPAKAEPGLSLEEMKQFVRNHFDDFVNRKKPEVALTNFSTDFLDHDEPTGVEVGPDAAKKMMEAAYQRWPDLKVTVEDILAEGDKVVVRNSWTATEAATGQGIEFHGFVLWRFANKKIVERWATITPPTPLGVKASAGQ